MITWDFVPFHSLFDELRPILASHYAEIAEDDEPFNFDWDMYELASRSGLMMTVTARDGEKLVGYIIFALLHDLRCKQILEATSNGWYVMPEYRGRLGAEILDKANEYLKAVGVNRTKFFLGGAASLLLKRKGYTTKHQVWEIKYE